MAAGTAHECGSTAGFAETKSRRQKTLVDCLKAGSPGLQRPVARRSELRARRGRKGQLGVAAPFAVCSVMSVRPVAASAAKRVQLVYLALRLSATTPNTMQPRPAKRNAVLASPNQIMPSIAVSAVPTPAHTA